MAERELQLLTMLGQKLIDLQHRADLALGQLSDEDVNWRPNEESNSITNIVLHLAGNLKQRINVGLGDDPDTRDRDAEFNDRRPRTRESLQETLKQAVTAANRVIAGLSVSRLDEAREAGGREQTVLELLFRVVAHFAEHVGQILYIAKLRRGSAYSVVSN